MGLDFDHGLTLRRLMIGITIQVFGLLGARDEARADCASGDGNITTALTCTVPQVLTGSTGTIVSGAALITNGTAYTISSSGGRLVNNGSITSRNNITVGGNVPSNITNIGDIEGGLVQRATEFIQTVTISLAGNSMITSSGTIGGSIIMGPNGIVNVTGGKILGDISVSTGGTLNFDLGTGSFTPNGNLGIAAINVQSGTLILPETVKNQFGVPIVSNFLGSANSLTNNGRLQINSLQPQSLSGVFVQKPASTLVMEITPTASSQLKISSRSDLTGGTATLAGTLELAYQPGIYSARNYTLLSAPNGINGTFSAVNGSVPTAGLTQSVSVGTQSVDLVLSGVSTGSLPAEAVVVAPTNDTVFSAATATEILNAQWANRALLDRWGSGRSGTPDPTAVARLALPARSQVASSTPSTAMDAIATALPETMARYGGWFWGAGNFTSLNGSATAPGFTARSGGFLAGIDQPAGDETWLGAAAGYSHTGLSEHSTSSGDTDTGRIALYGGTRLGPSVLSATIGYAYDRIATARSIAGIGSAQEGHDGQEVSVAAQANLPLDVSGVSVTPKAGIQFVNLFESNFAETGANGFNLTNQGRNTDSLQPYVAVSGWRHFVSDDGTAITPAVRLGYTREALSNSRQLTVATVSGFDFPVQGVKPSNNMLTAGLGLTLQTRDNIYLYADYNAVVRTGNTAYQVVSAGLRIRF
jgi:fibronectin-binding autotransporter adhesin